MPKKYSWAFRKSFAEEKCGEMQMVLSLTLTSHTMESVRLPFELRDILKQGQRSQTSRPKTPKSKLIFSCTAVRRAGQIQSDSYFGVKK